MDSREYGERRDDVAGSKALGRILCLRGRDLELK